MTGSKISLMKKAVLAAALVAATAGVASADDGGMGRFSDSYQYFASEPVNKSPSEWRAANPSGEPESWYQLHSAWGVAWNPAPTFTNVPSDPTFKQTHPNGLTEGELQALSSEASAWHSVPAGDALVSSEQTADAQGTSIQTFAARVARFFHLEQ